jgi:hypothetical protein
MIIKSTRPNELWVVDLIGRIQDNKGNNKFILVAIDHFTKWIETIVLDTKDATSTAYQLEELIIKKHGIPTKILSDNGLEFKNKEIEKLCEKFNIKWIFNSPNHHETVGAVERVNQTLMDKLKRITEFGRYSWERALKAATSAVNISYNRSIGMSPFMLVKSKLPDCEIDKIFETTNKELPKEYLIHQRNLTFNNYAKKAIEKGKQTIPMNLKIGDPVLIYKEPLKDKFSQKWFSGYFIKEIIEPSSYMVTNHQSDYRLNKNQVKLDESKIRRGDVVSPSSSL